MITKSGIDTKNFEYKSMGEICPEYYMSYSSNTPTGLYVIENDNGVEACITNVGARIVSLMVPDKDGQMQDVILGFDTLAGYIDIKNGLGNYQGAVIGRYANRIANGQFSIDNNTYTLAQNNHTNNLHAGPFGWAYQAYKVVEHTKDKLKLVLNSPDGDMGFPGNVEFFVTYTLTNDNALRIDYEATTDKSTVINVTNHSYFNLSGNFEKPCLDNKLFINSVQMTPINDVCSPTGEIQDIEKGGPFDFYGKALFAPKYLNNGKTISQDINANDEQIKLGNGYDHNFILQNDEQSTKARLPKYEDGTKYCAKLVDDDSGICMQIFTTEPGVQFYDAVDLDGKWIGKKGIPLQSNCAICLETQHFADSPNIPEFPSTQLNPGEVFASHSIYKFLV